MAYINKEDLLATINEVWERKYARCEWKTLYDLYRMCIRRINRAQVADVQEVKHAKWMTDRFGMERSICSICGTVYEGGDSFRFCPECGAKMDLEEKENETLD